MQRIVNVSLPVTKTLDGKLLHGAWVLRADVFLLHQKIKIKVEGEAHENDNDLLEDFLRLNGCVCKHFQDLGRK